MNDGQRMIAELESKRRAALIELDKEALGRLLSDELIWTHANGVTENKATYIAALGTKALFLEIEPVDEIIALHGDGAASVTSELKMSIQPLGKDPIVLRTRASCVWAREADDAWRLVRFHSGMVT